MLTIQKYFKNKYVRSISLLLLLVFILYILVVTNALIPGSFINIKINGNVLIDSEEINSNIENIGGKSMFLIFGQNITKNRWGFALFILLISALVYVLGFNTTMSYILALFFLIKEYRVYLYIIVLLSILFLILYFVLSLYIVHLFAKKKDTGVMIYISKTLPDFIIKYLEELECYSENVIAIKEFKRMYYIQIVIYSIIALFWLLFIFLL